MSINVFLPSPPLLPPQIKLWVHPKCLLRLVEVMQWVLAVAGSFIDTGRRFLGCSDGLWMTAFCVPAERNQRTVPAGPRVQPLQPAGERLLWHSLCGPWETEGNCFDHATAVTYNWNTCCFIYRMRAMWQPQCRWVSLTVITGLSPVKWQVFKSLCSLGSFWNIAKKK